MFPWKMAAHPKWISWGVWDRVTDRSVELLWINDVDVHLDPVMLVHPRDELLTLIKWQLLQHQLMARWSMSPVCESRADLSAEPHACLDLSKVCPIPGNDQLDQ